MSVTVNAYYFLTHLTDDVDVMHIVMMLTGG